MDKISIIIPVYNVEPYIKKCLDSVTSQTYTNIEIICVDDGSTDNSGKICDEYAKRDKRIIVFYKTNGGVSSAKNLGLKNITGDYVGFVDSDDWIEPNMYELLYTAIKKQRSSVSISSYYKDTDTDSYPMFNREQIPDGIISKRDMLLYPLKRDCYMGFCGYLWNKLFSVDILYNNTLTFDSNINYGEDVLFYTNVALSKGCSGVYIAKPLYHYYQRSTAITKTESLNVKTDILKVYEKVARLLENNGYADISFWAWGFYCHHASVIAEIALKKNDKKTLAFMQNEIRRYLADYTETNREFPEKFARMRNLLDVSIL